MGAIQNAVNQVAGSAAAAAVAIDKSIEGNLDRTLDYSTTDVKAADSKSVEKHTAGLKEAAKESYHAKVEVQDAKKALDVATKESEAAAKAVEEFKGDKRTKEYRGLKADAANKAEAVTAAEKNKSDKIAAAVDARKAATAADKALKNAKAMQEQNLKTAEIWRRTAGTSTNIIDKLKAMKQIRAEAAQINIERGDK